VKNRLDRTQEVPTVPVPSSRQRDDFRPGVAPIPAKREDPTLIEPTLRSQIRRPKPTMRHRVRNLRAGGGWTVAGLVVLVVCWALWAIQSGADSVKGSALVLLLIAGVAVGLFGLLRLVGSIVLEKLMNRQRRSSVLSHLAIGLFLTLAGASLLRQVEWVITSWNHLIGAR
jgi:hypothetical protein